MHYIVTTKKSVEESVEALRETVAKVNFGVLHVHNLKEKMNAHGVDFANECIVMEVCNPHMANKVLSVDMALNMALPCRISVYQEEGETKIGMLLPQKLLGILSSDEQLKAVATEVEAALIQAIDEAK